MDIKTVEFKPFTDQKPGTYVTVDPAPHHPAKMSFSCPRACFYPCFGCEMPQR